MAQRAWWTDWNLSYVDDVYGPVYGGHSIQEAFYNTLQKWLPTYIAEFNRKIGSNVLVEPFEYRHRPDYRTLPRNASAAILVSVPGTSSMPQVYQDAVRADWHVEVMVFVYGTKDWQETEALTQAYTTAVRMAIMQNKSLDGFATTTFWVAEAYMEGEHSSTRTTGLGRLTFDVTLGNVMNINAGLPDPEYAATGINTDPTTKPPGPRSFATSQNVEIQKD
jgi:hypothetical protein